MVLLRMLAFQPVGNSQQQAPVSGQKSAPVATKTKQTTPTKAEPPVISQTAEPSLITPTGLINDAAGWASLVAKLPLNGMTRQLAEHTAPLKHEGDVLELALDQGFENLLNPKWQEGLQQALDMYFGKTVKLNISSTEVPTATPKQMREERDNARQQEAEQSMDNDSALQSLLDHFDGQLESGSVRPAK
jgi:DNA polymerase-3 subunit gamma/tau